MRLFKQTALKSYLHGMVIDMNIGIHPWEKYNERPNKITIDIEMSLDIKNHPQGFIDYDKIRKYIINDLKNQRFDLLEELSLAIADYAFNTYELTDCKIKISKNDIFIETESPGIEVLYEKNG